MHKQAEIARSLVRRGLRQSPRSRLKLADRMKRMSRMKLLFFLQRRCGSDGSAK
jgi:hypothetical protein